MQKITNMVLENTQRNLSLIPHSIDYINALCRLLPQHPSGLTLLASLSASLMRLNVSVLKASLPNLLQLFTRTALEPSLDPTLLLQRLDAVLRNTDVCEQGDWMLGMALMDACASLMSCHLSSILLQPLGNLLLLVLSCYNDLDVRDAGMNNSTSMNR